MLANRLRGLVTALAVATVAVSCGGSGQATHRSDPVLANCPEPVDPRDAPTDADRALLATLVRGQPELSAVVTEGGGRLTGIVEWRNAKDERLLGKVATYQFAHRVELPTSYGIFHEIDKEAARRNDTEAAVVERANGLPVLYPITDPDRFQQSIGMSVFVSTLGDSPKVEYLLDDNSQSGPCPAGTPP